MYNRADEALNIHCKNWSENPMPPRKHIMIFIVKIKKKLMVHFLKGRTSSCNCFYHSKNGYRENFKNVLKVEIAARRH